MTTIPVQSGRETFAEGLMQALSAVQELAGLVGDVGEQTTVRTEYVVRVRSDAEVDGSAALMGVTPERTPAGTYRAVMREATVTVTIAHFADPAAPAGAAAIESACRQAVGNITGGAA